MLKTNREQRQKMRKISVLGIKYIGPRPLGDWRAPGAPPPLVDPLVDLASLMKTRSVWNVAFIFCFTWIRNQTRKLNLFLYKLNVDLPKHKRFDII